MQIINTLGPQEAARPHPVSRFARGWARRLLLALGLVSLTLGLVRLRIDGFTLESAAAVLRLWYLEALAFCGVFGAGSLAAGLLTRAREKVRRRRARRRNPLDTSPLAGVERRPR